MTTVQSGTRISWKQGRIVGPNPPLKPKHIWAIRTRLQHDSRVLDLAMFNTAIDSKLRGCDLVKLRVADIHLGDNPAVAHDGHPAEGRPTCSPRADRPDVNDFNAFGRVYQVRAQADEQFRLSGKSINSLRVRSSNGALVPLGTLVDIKDVSGPYLVQRYNMYTSVPLQGNAAPGVSSGQALDTMEKLAQETLPAGMSTQWTELSYQERNTGNTAVFIFALSVLFVFLVLSAQYESWSLPLAIILIATPSTSQKPRLRRHRARIRAMPAGARVVVDTATRAERLLRDLSSRHAAAG